MEQTELREAFFAEVRVDPYAHMLTQLFADAWATGYEEALCDHGLTAARLRESHSDRRKRAFEFLTDSRRKAEADMLIAMAQVGSLIGTPRRGAD